MLPSVNINLNISSDSLGIAKLVDTLAKGVGTLYAPIHIRKKGKAEAERIQSITEACRNSIDIPFNYKQDGLIIDTDKEWVDLAKRTVLRNLVQEMNKQHNIENVVSCARDILEHEQEVSREPVSQTWLSNFFESAGYVEEEDLQKIWGKLLAGEIKGPGSYSLRTLNALRNMTSKEAKIFQKIVNFSVRIGKNYFLPNQKNLSKKFNLPYEELLLLAENNLLTVDENLQTEGTVKAGDSHPIIYNNLIANISTTSSKEIPIHLRIFPFTSIGKELMHLTQIVPNQSFFIEYVKQIESQFRNTKTHIYKINKINVINGQEMCDCDMEHPIYPEK